MKNTKQQALGFIWVWSSCLWSCVFVWSIVRLLNGQSHLFENNEPIQEVNALAGEEFPDGLLSLSTLRVRGNTHLRELILEELSQ